MRAIPLRLLSASTVAFGTEFLVTHNSPEAMCDTQVVPFEMDLAVRSKDYAVTVASCGDTLTEIRYTTYRTQPPVFFSPPSSSACRHRCGRKPCHTPANPLSVCISACFRTA